MFVGFPCSRAEMDRAELQICLTNRAELQICLTKPGKSGQCPITLLSPLGSQACVTKLNIKFLSTKLIYLLQ